LPKKQVLPPDILKRFVKNALNESALQKDDLAFATAADAWMRVVQSGSFER